MKLEEESQLISHDLEDTAAKPSEVTVELTKSLIDCIEKYVNGKYSHILMPIIKSFSHIECRIHLMLYVALKEGELICLYYLYCKI